MNPEQIPELTKVMFKTQDIATSLAERAFPRNRTIGRAFLASLLNREQQGAPVYGRLQVRGAAKHLVRLGGVTIVDALTYDEVMGIVGEKLNELAPIP